VERSQDGEQVRKDLDEMKPVSFPEANTVYAEDQDEYLSLPAYRAPDGRVTSCWELTWKERLILALEGQIFFTVLTFNQPLQPQLPSALFEPEKTGFYTSEEK
jgi:hypothetical protein